MERLSPCGFHSVESLSNWAATSLGLRDLGCFGNPRTGDGGCQEMNCMCVCVCAYLYVYTHLRKELFLIVHAVSKPHRVTAHDQHC